jgi:hypothetical protein
MYTLHINGAVFATEQMFALSDRRVKKEIKQISNALDIVDKIGGYTFTMNNRRCVGVIAQDVLEACPEAVSSVDTEKGNQPLLSVSYDSLVGVLFEAIKDLRRQVDMINIKI